MGTKLHLSPGRELQAGTLDCWLEESETQEKDETEELDREFQGQV